jgi:E3 ubiquitin-protein ligase ZNF598
MVRRDGGAAVASAWGNGGASTPLVEEGEEAGEGKGKKKGNKGKKQVLMNWG